jgi:transcriptional regulator with XRE-family HTH domain
VKSAPSPKGARVTADAQRKRSRQGLRKDIGARLRQAREEKGIGLRELARRISVSPAMLSQIETGKSEPSISTLFAIISELSLPVNEIVFDLNKAANPEPATMVAVDQDEQPGVRAQGLVKGNGTSVSPVQHPHDRRSIQLESGVIWDRLTAQPDHDVDFLILRYPPGSESTPPEALMRHNGREYGYVLSGRLTVTLGFDEYELGPGSSISFDCTQPHRFANHTDEPVEAVWWVLGRNRTQPSTSD